MLSEIQKNHKSKDPEKVKKAQSNYLQLWKSFNGEKPDKDVTIDLLQVKDWSQELSREIRHILEPVIIRRNRIDLRSDPDYKDEVTELSNMKPPVEQFFALTPEQSAFYDSILNDYFGESGRFKGAIYQPFAYEQNDQKEKSSDDQRELMLQSNLYDFMRRLLVHRFESSFGAFAQSLENFLEIHKKAQVFIKRTGKFVLDRKLLEKIYESDDDVIKQALDDYENMLSEEVLPKNNKVYIIDSFSRKEEFLTDIQNDIELFDELIQKVKDLELASKDPKAACLATTLFSVINGCHKDLPQTKDEPRRKVIVFSEYTDTIRHLEQYLQTKLRNDYLCSWDGFFFIGSYD